ncbi:MAG: prepilin-type N-terminal cleavage/methylation domain-containing protein [Candidatus Omnitrophota bacterium]
MALIRVKIKTRWLSLRKKERKKERSFTLIELIIVVVIIGILALVAIPRYFANVAKAQKTQVYANLDAIRQTLLGYYAVNGVWPATNTWPSIVTVDGDTISQISNPSTSQWDYRHFCQDWDYLVGWKEPGNTCYYRIWCSSGADYDSTCTP